MRANVGQIVGTNDGAALFARLLATSAEVAGRSGCPPSDRFMAEYRALFADAGSRYATSMLRDIERGARTEGAQIVGLMAEKARAHGIDDILLDAAYAHLQAYEARREAGGI